MASRDDLWKAWDEAVERAGEGPAKLALTQATGTDTPDAVPDDKIEDGIKALKKVIAPPPIPIKARIRAAAMLPKATVREKFRAMAHAIYGQPR